MKFLILTTVMALLTGAAPTNTAGSKTVIVTFPDNTPWNVMQDAKDAIVADGGRITHEYSIIKYVPSWASRGNEGGITSEDESPKTVASE